MVFHKTSASVSVKQPQGRRAAPQGRHAAPRSPAVAFQGELGAFSQQAILQFLGPKAKPQPYERFDQIFAALQDGNVDAVAVPIENTLHGSVHENYDLLLKYDFAITAETSVRIVHNLIAPPGVTLRNVRTVYSHPVAINQCLEFFASHPRIRREPFYDTAGSVKMVMEQRPPGTAAIASELAAQIYGGHILKRGIEDDRQNYTRFFLLEPKGSPPRKPRGSASPGGGNESGKGPAGRPWKTSLVFTTRNVPGALFRALSALALRDLNLVKIESRPLRGKPWEYLFYLDLLGRPDEEAVRNALGHLREIADFLRVLGTYRAA
jgi:prephenate dehydratase